MSYQSGTCWCCRQQRPIDYHHVSPIAYSGPRDGKQVPLCGACHKLAHYEAEYYFANGHYHEIDTTIPESTGMGIRLRKLAQKIIETKQQWLDNGQDDAEQRRMTQISWASSEELAMAHDLKRALKFTSLERAIKFCVFEVHKALRNKGKL